jgi:hypothetical protein
VLGCAADASARAAAAAAACYIAGVDLRWWCVSGSRSVTQGCHASLCPCACGSMHLHMDQAASVLGPLMRTSCFCELSELQVDVARVT